jgi:hypothetical protein
VSRRLTRACLSLVALLGLASVVPAATAQPAAPAIAVDVRISGFAPIAPKPGDTVTITGTATNRSRTVLTRPQAIACSEPGRIDDRAGLAALPPEGNGCKGLVDEGSTAFHDFADALEPNVSKRFTITVPWQQWKLGDRNGVYVVGVRINADDPDGNRVSPGVARTLMPVVAENTKLRTVRTAMVLTLRHRPTQLAGTYFSDESLLDELDPEQGRLSRLVAAGAKQRVTWLIDPSLLDEVRQLAEGYRTDGASGVPPEPSPVAGDWLVRLAQAIGQDPVVLLPYADPDVRALVDGKLERLVAQARELGAASRAPGGRPALSGFWLDNDAADGATLAAAAGTTPADITLLSNWSWPAGSGPDTGPVVRVNTSRGPVRAVVADQALMAGGPDPLVSNGPVQLRQRLAAETALLALDTGGAAKPAPVTVAVVPGRGFDTLGTATGTLLQAMTLPWVSRIGLNELGTEPTQTVPAPQARPATPVLSEPQLDAVRKIDSDIATFTGMLATPIGKAPLERSKLRATSLTWRGAQAEADKFRRYQLTVLRQQLGKVHILSTDGPENSVVTLSASDGRFPLTVANDLTVPVRVGLRIEPLNRDDLKVEPVEPVRIRGGNRETFEIRASAQQNGLIKARVHIVTDQGREVGEPLELDIRAAQYGTVGWVLVGSAVALLFGTSAIRIYRRIRSERRAAAKSATKSAAQAATGSAAQEAGPGLTTGPRTSTTPAEPAVPAVTAKTPDV